MLEFRTAAAANNFLEMERLSKELGDNFNIDEPGPKSGKTAAHVAAERESFKAIYWLFDKKANFYLKDNLDKTAIDYLQQKELTPIGSNSMVKGDRKYYLCNAHYKIWLAHDRECFMPYLYQDDFRQYRERNPDGYISLVYSESLLGNTALSDLLEFAEKYKISLISFEKDLAELTQTFGTDGDKQCYQLALQELNQYPNQGGGNLAVVADLIRWSSVLLRKGNYSDTDVEIGQHTWTNSISMEKSIAFNLGSLVYPHMTTPWLNGDVIAVSSLFSQPHSQGDFRITLSKSACFIIQKVQLSLVSSCQNKLMRRINAQQFLTKNFTNLTFYTKDYFKSCGSENFIINNFSSAEINKIQTGGLESFTTEERAFILERIANLMRRKVEQEFGSREMAHKYSKVFRNVRSDEHEKFLRNYMKAIQMSNIKEGVKQLTGTYVFSRPVWGCIQNDDWKKYSIYNDELVESAFRSTNTVKFDTDNEENEKVTKTKKCADLSFTPSGMEDVLQRSQALKVEHQKNHLI